MELLILLGYQMAEARHKRHSFELKRRGPEIAYPPNQRRLPGALSSSVTAPLPGPGRQGYCQPTVRSVIYKRRSEFFVRAQ